MDNSRYTCGTQCTVHGKGREGWITAATPVVHSVQCMLREGGMDNICYTCGTQCTVHGKGGRDG